MNRSRGKRIAFNNDPAYGTLFQKRGISGIRQFSTTKLRYPTAEEIQSDITEVSEFWKVGDQLWKYAERYYQDGELWWILAWYNKGIFFNIGDQILIPLPLDRILKLLNV
jgi:hypothetical protein